MTPLVLVKSLLGEYVNLEVIIKLLEKLGFEEDLPPSKPNLDYGTLNMQSKRIINRVVDYMIKNHNSSYEEMFSPIVKTKTVKSKTKTDQVDIIKAEDLLSYLHSLSLIKSPSSPRKDNLCKFLSIDPAYPD